MTVDKLAASELKRKEALTCLEQSRDPNLSAEARLAKIKDADAILEEALKVNPDNHRARFLLVSCAMNADNFQRAKDEGLIIWEALTPEQRGNMGDAVLHISLAHAAKMLGDLDDAIMFASEASHLYPEDPHPQMILGELFEASDQNAEAEQMCRQALRHTNEASCKHPLNPQSVYFTYCCLGACLIKQGKHTEAERFLTQALELGSSSTLAHRHLVDVYHFQGRHDEALQVAHRLAEMDPYDEEIRQKIEILMQTTGSEGEESGVHYPQGTLHHKGNANGGFDVVEVHPNSARGSDHSRRHGSDGGSVRPTSERSSRPSARQNSQRSHDKLKAGSKKGEQTAPSSDSSFCCCFEKTKDHGDDHASPRKGK